MMSGHRPETGQYGRDGLVLCVMPSGRNKVLVVLGFALGVPWILAFAVGSVAAPFLVPPEMVREAVLGAVIVNLLFSLVHILAVAGVWLAIYNVSGYEVLSVSKQRVTVRRTAIGFSVPIRLGRTGGDHASVLDVSHSPGRVAHPRIEIRAGDSRMRLGAGLSESEARALATLANELLHTSGLTSEGLVSESGTEL